MCIAYSKSRLIIIIRDNIFVIFRYTFIEPKEEWLWSDGILVIAGLSAYVWSVVNRMNHSPLHPIDETDIPISGHSRTMKTNTREAS